MARQTSNTTANKPLRKRKDRYTVAYIEAYPEKDKPSKITKYDRVGEKYVEVLAPGVEIELVKIPEGTFLMGAPDEGTDENYSYASSAERPQHLVAVFPFYMAKYTVTQKLWRWVAENLPKIEHDLHPDPSNFKGDNRPVESVSWIVCQEFCARLRAYTGRDYRLPSEAEWEYACRAGTTTPFHFGNTIESTLANFDGNFTYGDGKPGPFLQETTPVGHYGVANEWGLFDMHGNVWEWCEDTWHDNYNGAPFTSVPWVDPPELAFLTSTKSPKAIRTYDSPEEYDLLDFEPTYFYTTLIPGLPLLKPQATFDKLENFEPEESDFGIPCPYFNTYTLGNAWSWNGQL